MAEPQDRRARSAAANDSFETRLRGVRPEPPAGLAARCLPPRERESELTSIHKFKGRSMRNRVLAGGGGVAVAAAVVLAVIYSLPSSPGVSTASALAIRQALDELDQTQIASVEVHYDEGPGTPPRERARMLLDARRGIRVESSLGVLVYDALRQRKFEFDPAQNRVRETPYRDPIQLGAQLKRIRADQNIEVLRTLAFREQRAFTDELVLDGEMRVRRISSTDDAGKPLSIEIDPGSLRVLRTIAWTVQLEGFPSVRVVTQFEYPESTDPAAFTDPSGPDAEREIASVDSAARTACMLNLRNLCMMVMTYAADHDNRLPKSIDELKPYAGEEWELCITCRNPGGEPLHVRDHLATLGVESAENLDPGSVLFEVDLIDGVAIGFGDGHVEFKTRE